MARIVVGVFFMNNIAIDGDVRFGDFIRSLSQMETTGNYIIRIVGDLGEHSGYIMKKIGELVSNLINHQKAFVLNALNLVERYKPSKNANVIREDREKIATSPVMIATGAKLLFSDCRPAGTSVETRLSNEKYSSALITTSSFDKLSSLSRDLKRHFKTILMFCIDNKFRKKLIKGKIDEADILTILEETPLISKPISRDASEYTTAPVETLLSKSIDARPLIGTYYFYPMKKLIESISDDLRSLSVASEKSDSRLIDDYRTYVVAAIGGVIGAGAQGLEPSKLIVVGLVSGISLPVIKIVLGRFQKQ